MNESILFCQECGSRLETLYAVGSEFRKCPKYVIMGNHTHIYIKDIEPKFDPKTGEQLR